MFKKLFGVALMLALVLPVSSSAMDMTGKVGLGYFQSDAPIGLRYWFSDKTGFDAGLGFESFDRGAESEFNFYLEGGLDYVIFGGDRANLMLRPGILARFLDEDFNANEMELVFKLLAAGEVFFGENFSLEAGHGLEIVIENPSAPGADSQTNIFTNAASITGLGFHFYFK